jgi:hypothetical protein
MARKHPALIRVRIRAMKDKTKYHEETQYNLINRINQYTFGWVTKIG